MSHYQSSGRRFGTARPTIAPVPIVIPEYTRVKTSTKHELAHFVSTDSSKASEIGQNGSQVPLILDGNGEYDFQAYRDNPHPTTDSETLTHLLKGCLGSGILAMPMAFKSAGTVFGIIATVVVGYLCSYGVHLLVKSAQIMYRRARVPALDYAGVAEKTFEHGPGNTPKYRRLAKAMVDWFLVLDLYGACCVYIVFIASNMKQVIDFYTETNYDLRFYMAAILPVLIAICLVRTLKYLAPLSLLANLLMAVSMAITLYYCISDLPPFQDTLYIAPVTAWPLFFGVVIFALEGIGVVMPLENQMKTATHFTGCPSVLCIGMSVVIGLYAVVGFFGFWKYGDKTEGAITLNLPTHEMLAQSVKIMIAICMLCTYPLQFYVPMSIIWKNFGHRFSKFGNCAEYTIRIFLIIMTVVIAAAVPNLGALISLIGALCLSTLGLIFPAIIELVVHWGRQTLGTINWRLYKDITIIVIGVVAGVLGSYLSLAEIIHAYDEK